MQDSSTLLSPASTPAHATRPTAHWIRIALAIAVGAVVVGLIWFAQVLPGVDASLVDMGFDPDRARLLSALTMGGLTAAGASLLTGGRIAPVLVGAAVFGAFDFARFRTETLAALASRGADGRFDPLGWLLTGATLAIVGLVICWASSLIALAVRNRLLPLARIVQAWAGRRRPARRELGRLGAAGAVALALAVAGSTFGDLMNYSPDVHMRSGASLPLGLFSGPASIPSSGPGGAPGTGSDTGTGAGGPSNAPAASQAAIDTVVQTGRLVAGPLPGSFVSPGALSTQQPWAAHPPSGTGRISTAFLPGPWIGGTRSAAQVDIYLPPGYGSPGVRYPVVYEAHYPLDKWTSSMQLPAVLDALITSGSIPPEIFVFASTGGGPYADSECADSYDGREWFNRYVATTLVSFIDGHYPTIATPAARSLMGFSQGGYCAAALLFRHPDVFGQAISLSGYFSAGLETRTTLNAWMPFHHDPAFIRAASPINLATTMPAAARARLFIVLSADPASLPFGPEMVSFASVLAQQGFSFALVPTPDAHSWPVVRTLLPTFLRMVAQRQVALGVFG